MEQLGNIVVLQGGALAVLTLFSAGVLWALLRGKLVTESQHLREVAYREVRIAEERAEKDMWRDTAKISSAQVERLLEGQETTLQLLRSLPKADPE